MKIKIKIPFFIGTKKLFFKDKKGGKFSLHHIRED